MPSEKDKKLKETLDELNALFRGLTENERDFVDKKTDIPSRLQALEDSKKPLVSEGKNVRLACFFPPGGQDFFQKLLKKLRNSAIILTRREWNFEIVVSRETSFELFDERSARASAQSAGAEALIVISPGALAISSDNGVFCRAIRADHVGSHFYYADLVLDMAGYFHVPAAPRARACDPQEKRS